MSRLHCSSRASLAALALLGLGVWHTAAADDNSMSPLTGDSYAYFNGLDYHPGGFNAPRSAAVARPDPLVRMPSEVRERADRRILLAESPRATRLTSPFRDDTGA